VHQPKHQKHSRVVAIQHTQLGASEFQVANLVGKSQENVWIGLKRVQSNRIQACDCFSLGFAEEGLSLQGWNHETSRVHSETWLVFPVQRTSCLLHQLRPQAARRDFNNVVVASTCSALLRAVDIGESEFLS